MKIIQARNRYRQLLRLAAVACSFAGIPANRTRAAPPKENAVEFSGQKILVWEKRPAAPKAAILLLQGEFDPIAPTDAQARSFVRFGNADRQWVVLAGGDHAAVIENMQPAFVAAIVNFLERPRAK